MCSAAAAVRRATLNRVSGVRDYVAWHEQYADPGSTLPRRLAMVREALHGELDARPGPVRVVSLCAGDGRDLLGVLAERDDAARVSATLVEVLPELVDRARDAAAGLAAEVEVVAADAGRSDTYAGLATVPADVVLLVGVLGNLADADVGHPSPRCPSSAPRGRRWCGAAAAVSTAPSTASSPRCARRSPAPGFTEVSRRRPFDVADDHTTLGVVRYDGPAVPLERGARWFTFVG